MLFSILSALTLAGTALAAPVADDSACSAQQRLYHSNQVIVAYAQKDPASTYAKFAEIPFGVPDLKGPCTTTIYPNGGSGITVGVDGQGVVNFGTESRQVFYEVTGNYVDFPNNGTTVIYTNVTAGTYDVDSGVTFSGQVYLDFNTLCRITAVRAYAEIPTYIDGQPTDLYKYLPLPQLPEPI